jgi:hypothetical protein
VGGGFHYLTNSSPYRNVGTTNITPEMAAILKRTTTYPPIVYSNATISVPTTLGPQAQRDTDLPDLGYHYDPLDYAFGGCDANTNLTFSAGTAVGWFRTTSGWYHAGHGIHIADRQLLQFQGRAESPCYWVRANMVQEQSSGAPWQGGYGPGGITSWANQDGPYANAPTVEARFLICSLNDLNNHFRDDYGILIARFRDCEFYAGGVGGYNSTYDYTNCLFYRVGVSGLNEGRSGNEFVARNCTWYGGNIYLTPSQAATPVSIKDCALDGTSVTASGYAANPSYASYDYNAYTDASNPFPLGGGNDQQSVTFNWQTGHLGRFYLPTNSTLVNAGSLAANTAVGLYHFTTQTNQVKETNSTVDIGYHYVAWDIAGNKPVDTDGDGAPDYWEDRNGNGSADGGETDWQSYNSLNGLNGASALQVFTPLK